MPPKKKNGYKMPDPLPAGEILQDLYKKQWRLGPSIGKGGFGEIYSAQEAGSKGASYPFVIKIEPHANGPLFVEMHFYSRTAKQADIDAFKASKKMSHLGMPAFIGSGSHEHKGEKYRFVVMEKFGSDIWKLYLGNNKKFPDGTAFKLTLQMLDVLEYIHSKGYVHADLKGANILLSIKNPNQAYLVDFGLAGKFSKEKEFKPNPKKMHDGTIEYLSRDAHQGVQTRRGDLEILAYNLIHWLGCNLPWEKNLSDPKTVQASKEKSMSDIPAFMKTCFAKSPAPEAVVTFLNYINKLKFNEEPDYAKIRKILQDGLKKTGDKSSTLQFKASGKRQSVGGFSSPEDSPKKKPRTQEDEVPKKRGRTVAVKKTDGEEEAPKPSGSRKIAVKPKEAPKPKKTGRKLGANDEIHEDVRPERSARLAKKNVSYENLSEEEVAPKKAVSKGKKKKQVVPKKALGRRKNIEKEETEEDSDEDPNPIKRAVIENNDSEEDIGDTDDDEEKEEVTQKKAVSKGKKQKQMTPKKTLGRRKKIDKEETEEDSDEDPNPIKRAVIENKKNDSEEDIGDTDDDEEIEEVKPKKAVRKGMIKKQMTPKKALGRRKKFDKEETEEDSDEDQNPIKKAVIENKENGSEEDIGDTDDDEEKEVTPKKAVSKGKKTKQMTPKKALGRRKKIDKEETEEDSDEDPSPIKKAVIENKKNDSEEDIGDTDEDEEEPINVSNSEVEDTHEFTESNHNITVRRGKQHIPNGFDEISDVDEGEEAASSDEHTEEKPKTVQSKKLVPRGRRPKLQKSTSDDELETKRVVPKKRERRVNTDTTENYTAEMLRIMNMKKQKHGGKLNRLKDFRTFSQSSGDEILPVSKRAAKKM